MTKEEYRKLPLDKAIKLINISIGVNRKVTGLVDSKPLRYPCWLIPEADTFMKEKEKE